MTPALLVSFLAFIGATFHGIASGSDSGARWAFWLYLGTVTAAVFLITYRVVVGVSSRISRPGVERAGVPEARSLVLHGPLDRPGANLGVF